MPRIESYSVMLYGGPDGHQTNRAQISLRNAAGSIIAYVRFNDEGQTFESDSDTNGVILMHLPSAMLGPTVDILRNEAPMRVYFVAGKGFLTTSSEPVGEHEV